MTIETSQSGERIELIRVTEQWAFTIDLTRHGYDQGFVCRHTGQGYITVANWELALSGELKFTHLEEDDIPEHVTKVIRLNAHKSGKDDVAEPLPN